MPPANPERLSLKAVSSLFALFGLGGGEIVLILALILLIFGARALPGPVGELEKTQRHLRFDNKTLINGITLLFLTALAFTVLACLR